MPETETDVDALDWLNDDPDDEPDEEPVPDAAEVPEDAAEFVEEVSEEERAKQHEAKLDKERKHLQERERALERLEARGNDLRPSEVGQADALRQELRQLRGRVQTLEAQTEWVNVDDAAFAAAKVERGNAFSAAYEEAKASADFLRNATMLTPAQKAKAAADAAAAQTALYETAAAYNSVNVEEQRRDLVAKYGDRMTEKRLSFIPTAEESKARVKQPALDEIKAKAEEAVKVEEEKMNKAVRDIAAGLKR